MARTRISTTVDDALLRAARAATAAPTDAALFDQALDALLSRHRRAVIDESYSAYDEQPLDEPDEWGDLASFHDGVASS